MGPDSTYHHGMEASDIIINVQRERRQVGQVVSVTALAPSGRILGVVELQIPLLPNFPLSERIGASAEEELIQTARDLVRRIAVGVLTEPANSGRGNYWLNHDANSHRS